MSFDSKVCVFALRTCSLERPYLCTCTIALSVRSTFACNPNGCLFRIFESLEKFDKTDENKRGRE